jgi:hypothetical protein
VRTGLTLLSVALLLLLAGIGVTWLLTAAELRASGLDSEGPGTGVLVLLTVMSFGIIAGAVLLTASLFMSCFVPEEAGAKAFAGIAIFFLVTAFLTLLLMYAGRLENERIARANLRRALDASRRSIFDGEERAASREEVTPYTEKALRNLRWAAVGIGVVSSIFLTLFLWRVARFFGRQVLAILFLGFLPVWLLNSGVSLFLAWAVDEAALQGKAKDLSTLAMIFVAVGLALGAFFLSLVVTLRVTMMRAMTR